MAVTDQELAALEKAIETKTEEVEKADASPAKAEAPPPSEATSQANDAAINEPSSEAPPANDFNPSDWVKKKGWKTPEDAARSMRELEKELHKKAEENRMLKESQAAYVPPPAPFAYTPPAPPQGYYPPQAAYAPPANPYAPRSQVSEEQVAASYGMTPEDFRRVLAVSRDMADVQSRQMAGEFKRWKDEVDRTNEKQTDMAQVMADPAFHTADVQYEMHEQFAKNPSLLNERRPWSAALEKALTNIGRRNLGKGAPSTGLGLPTDPPKTAGSGNAGGSLPGKRGLGAMPSIKEMEGKTPEELEKILKGLNAVKTYADM